MSFEVTVIAFSERFLSDRTFELIVAPALADLQFDEDAGRRSRLANRGAVIRAVAGGLCEDFWRDSFCLLKLSLLSACYFLFPLALGVRAFKTWSEFLIVATGVLAMSMVPVVVCFWPARRTARPID